MMFEGSPAEPVSALATCAARRLSSLVHRAERLGVPVLTLATLPAATKLRTLTLGSSERPSRPKRSRRSRRSRTIEPEPASAGSSVVLLVASIALLVVVSGYSNGGGGPRIDVVSVEEPLQKVHISTQRWSPGCFRDICIAETSFFVHQSTENERRKSRIGLIVAEEATNNNQDVKSAATSAPPLMCSELEATFRSSKKSYRESREKLK